MSPDEIVGGIVGMLDTPYSVDFDAIYSKAELISRTLSTVLGIAAVLLVVFVTTITVIDICYLTIPLMREAVHTKGWDGRQSERKFRLISGDARIAYEEWTLNDKDTPIVRYVKRRIWTLLICGAILAIIVGYSDTLIIVVRKIVIDAMS